MTRRRFALAIVLMVVAAGAIVGGGREITRPEPARPGAVEPTAGGSRDDRGVVRARQRGTPSAAAPLGELEWAIPMLAHESPERQLETLRWLKTVPEDKVVAACASLIDERAIPIGERTRLALAMIDQYIDRLEQEGVTAPRSDGVVAVQIVER